MEPLLIVLVPGLLGGFVLALLLASKREGPPSLVVPRRLAPPSPSLINMSHIRVDGIGGLGMVAAVVVVAIADPRIRLATIIAVGLGAGLAWLLIAIRRRSGGMQSGDDPDNRFSLRTATNAARIAPPCAKPPTRRNPGLLAFGPCPISTPGRPGRRGPLPG
jgi:hypothetical protein